MEIKTDYIIFWLLLFILNFFLFKFYIFFAKKLNFLDLSKKFKNPITPTSSGVILYVNILIGIFFILKDGHYDILPNNSGYAFISLTILVIISFFDDVKSIDPKIRLFFQLICIYVSLTSVEIVKLPLPFKASLLFSLLIWVYIMNITNFIDGSDGFLGTNTLFVFINIVFLTYYLKLNIFSGIVAFFFLPSLVIFVYFFNKPNAKLYLGDTGSILIGYINGFIFLELIILQQFNIAISLYIYSLIDCSNALIKKTLDGKLPWVDVSNYSFLQPGIKKNANKIFVFYINIIFNIINSLLIIVQILFGWKFIILNILISLITMRIYEKK